MPRPASTIPRSSLTLRVDQEFKDRLLAVMFYELVMEPGSALSSPDELNVSERIRQLLDEYIELGEKAYGGREALALVMAEARQRQYQAALERAQADLTGLQSSRKTT